MSSDKRNFKDFTSFPGNIDKDKTKYTFPKLLSVSALGQPRYWQIFVRLIKKGAASQIKKTYTFNWNKLAEDEISIKSSYLTDTKLIKGAICQIWQTYGIVGRPPTNPPPTIKEAKLIGSAGQRNCLQQGLIYARSMWCIKQTRGYTEDLDNRAPSDIYYPMLAKREKIIRNKLVYPIAIQPKLDGVRCLAFIRNNTVILYTRRGKIYSGHDYIKKELIGPLMKMRGDTKSLYLDGELYKHGKALQDISGEARRESDRAIKNLNQYHIYDAFYPDKMHMPFKLRTGLVRELFAYLGDSKYVKYVRTDIIKKSEQKKWFDDIIDKGYEGAILRNLDAPYGGNSTGSGTRSNGLGKLKKVFSGEYEVVDYTEGRNGGSVGTIIWICKTSDGNLFKVTPKDITNIENKALFKKVSKGTVFEDVYKNRKITVVYEDLSKKGIPLRGKACNFRDFK